MDDTEHGPRDDRGRGDVPRVGPGWGGDPYERWDRRQRFVARADVYRALDARPKSDVLPSGARRNPTGTADVDAGANDHPAPGGDDGRVDRDGTA